MLRDDLDILFTHNLGHDRDPGSIARFAKQY